MKCPVSGCQGELFVAKLHEDWREGEHRRCDGLCGLVLGGKECDDDGSGSAMDLADQAAKAAAWDAHREMHEDGGEMADVADMDARLAEERTKRGLP